MPGPAPADRPALPRRRLNWWQRLRSDRVVVHDESMVPTLLPGDRLLVDRKAYLRSPPAVGDIVILLDPEGSRLWLIKRVAAVGPGRFWKTRSGLAVASTDTANAVPPSDAIEAVTLADSSVYVTGDGATARDSRHFGPIPVRTLVGRAFYRYAPPNRTGSL